MRCTPAGLMVLVALSLAVGCAAENDSNQGPVEETSAEELLQCPSEKQGALGDGVPVDPGWETCTSDSWCLEEGHTDGFLHPERRWCDERKRCVECTVDPDCDQGELCDAEEGQCVYGERSACQSTGDCQPTPSGKPACIEGVCVPCRSDANCGAGYVCRVYPGLEQGNCWDVAASEASCLSAGGCPSGCQGTCRKDEERWQCGLECRPCDEGE